MNLIDTKLKHESRLKTCLRLAKTKQITIDDESKKYNIIKTTPWSCVFCDGNVRRDNE